MGLTDPSGPGRARAVLLTMGKRARRQRREGAPPPGAASFADLGLDLDLTTPPGGEPTALHRDAEGRVLELRTALSPGTRAEYLALWRGDRLSAASAREDVWQRAVEFLFERLAVSWTVAEVTTAGQAALLARLRAATRPERESVRAALRNHVAEHFPELRTP